jgi:hypothetical protein
MAELEEVLFEYVAQGNPKSNEHLKRFPQRFPGTPRGDHRLHGDVASLVNSGDGAPRAGARSSCGATDIETGTGTLARPAPPPGEGSRALTKLVVLGVTACGHGAARHSGAGSVPGMPEPHAQPIPEQSMAAIHFDRAARISFSNAP